MLVPLSAFDELHIICQYFTQPNLSLNPRLPDKKFLKYIRPLNLKTWDPLHQNFALYGMFYLYRDYSITEIANLLIISAKSVNCIF